MTQINYPQYRKIKDWLKRRKQKSRHCCWCGNPITAEVGETDLPERKLCSDGNCIGTINEEGVCNICGKP